MFVDDRGDVLGVIDLAGRRFRDRSSDETTDRLGRSDGNR